MRRIVAGLLLLALASGAALFAAVSEAARYLTAPPADPLRFTVGEVRCGRTQLGTHRLGQRARGEFCLVPITVTNVSSTVSRFPATCQQAFDAAGVAFTPDGAAALYADDRNRKLLQTIEPGHRVRGTLVYDVPEAGRLATIVLHAHHSPGVRFALDG